MNDLNIILLFIISVLVICLVFLMISTKTKNQGKTELINNNISIETDKVREKNNTNPILPYNPYYAHYYPNNYYPWHFRDRQDCHRGYTGHNGKIFIKM
jgi:hypothetical protein